MGRRAIAVIAPALVACLVMCVSVCHRLAIAEQGVAIEVDGNRLAISAFIEDNRTLVPFRAIFEALGAEVSWDADTRTVTGRRGDKTICLTIGQKTAKVNGAPVGFDVAPQIRGDRTYVPARLVAEALGMKVEWDPTRRLVSVCGQSASAVPADDDAIRLRDFAFVDTEGLGMEAFRMVVPADWQAAGGIRWRKERPLLPASLAFRVTSEDGKQSLECFQDEAYFWVDAQGLLFPYDYGPQLRGQYARIYGGFNARRSMDAASYIANVLVPRYRGSVADLRVVETKSLRDSDVAVRLREMLGRRPKGPFAEQADVDAAQIRVAYTENGREVEEEFWGILVTDSRSTTSQIESATGVRMTSTFWYADSLWALKAEKGGLSARDAKLLMTVMQSFRWNSQWLDGYARLLTDIWQRVLQGAMDRAEIAARTQGEVARTIDSTFTNQESVMDKVSQEWSEAIRGVEAYSDRNPGLSGFQAEGGEAVYLPNGYHHAWTNGRGDYILTDNSNFNPNIEFHSSDWREMSRVQ